MGVAHGRGPVVVVGLGGGSGEGRIRSHVFVLNSEVEKNNKIYIQVNQTFFSQNSAVVTQTDSGWVTPGSNPWLIDQVIIKISEIV